MTQFQAGQLPTQDGAAGSDYLDGLSGSAYYARVKGFIIGLGFSRPQTQAIIGAGSPAAADCGVRWWMEICGSQPTLRDYALVAAALEWVLTHVQGLDTIAEACRKVETLLQKLGLPLLPYGTEQPWRGNTYNYSLMRTFLSAGQAAAIRAGLDSGKPSWQMPAKWEKS